MSTPTGFKDAYRQFCELGWHGLAKDPEFGGQGMPHLVAAAVEEMWNASNMAFDLCADTDRRCDRGDRVERDRHAQAHLFAEDGCRRMDRHDESHRAAGRIRPRRDPHEGGAAGRRHLQALRQQDLHHLRRARLHRQHRPPGARAHARRAAGHQGPVAVRGAEGPGESGWQPRQPQRRALRLARAQARHPREPHRGARVRRSRRRRRLPGRRGEPGTRIHVRDDERRALRRGDAGRRRRRARLSARGGLRARAGAGPGRRRGKRCRGDGHHRAPRRAADADDDAGQHRSGARAGVRHRGGARSRASAPGGRCAAARAGLRRADDS